MIPDEQPVPARVLGAPRQVGDDAGVGEVAEVRHIDGEAHEVMLALGLRFPRTASGPHVVAHYLA
ncbi:MAG TPA: hypothetical protein VIY52_29725 [Streptosporangiaceae bacterium]